MTQTQTKARRETRSNVDEIYKEYRFLHRICPRVKVRSATVKNCPSFSIEHPEVTAHWESKTVYRFYLLDGEGKILGRVGQRLKFFTTEEHITQTLAHMGDNSNKVRYGIFLGDNQHLTLYKFPERVLTLKEKLDAGERKSRREMLIMRLVFWAGVFLALFAALNALPIPSPWKQDTVAFYWAWVGIPASLSTFAFALNWTILPSYYWGESPF